VKSSVFGKWLWLTFGRFGLLVFGKFDEKYYTEPGFSHFYDIASVIVLIFFVGFLFSNAYLYAAISFAGYLALSWFFIRLVIPADQKFVSKFEKNKKR